MHEAVFSFSPSARGERVLPALIARQPVNFVKGGTMREIEEKNVQEKNGTARHLGESFAQVDQF